MKSNLMHSRVQMEQAILENLVKEVKETVAKGVKLSRARQRSFGTLDLWAIRRKRRYTAHTHKQPAIIAGSGY